MKKIVTIFTIGFLSLGLCACGSKTSSSVEKSKSTISNSTNDHHNSKSRNKNQSNLNNKTKISNRNTENYSASVSSTTNSSNSRSNNSASEDESRVMTATDAKNVVKEHILNKINTAGINGQPKPNVPTMDEIDQYSATQNGVNDWTVSGNGHVYHVTSRSVSEQ